jgi:hypothetical protein
MNNLRRHVVPTSSWRSTTGIRQQERPITGMQGGTGIATLINDDKMGDRMK